MKKKLLILIWLLCFFQDMRGQDFRLFTRSEEKKKDKNLLRHYTSREDDFAGSELLLYKNGKFIYRGYTDLQESISTGQWFSKGTILELKSTFGKSKLPVLVTYQARVANNSAIKKFAIIKDLKGREYIKSTIHINNDSVSCFGGDIECFGVYQSIDSVKVAINDEVYSQWYKVDSTRGIIQLTLDTDTDLHRYFPLHRKFRMEKNNLKEISN